MTDKEFLEKLGKRIAKVRRANGLSQLDLCSKINMEKSNLSAIENGRQNATSLTLKRIAEGIGCEIGEFFDLLLTFTIKKRLPPHQTLFIFNSYKLTQTFF